MSHNSRFYFILFLCILSVRTYSQTYQFGTNISNGTVITTCSGTFYDSGGLLGNYNANEDYVVTFTSATADPISMNFVAFSLESTNTCSNDRMLVYDGVNTSAPLLGTFCGLNTPSRLTSSGRSLTFRFISNGTTQSFGWAATVACADCATADCSEFVNLVFQNPVVEANPTGLVGDKWRFPSVMAGYDAIVEITNAVRATAIANIDNPVGPTGSWSPEITLNLTNGLDSYVDWRITMVAAGTNTPTNLPLSSRLTSYDVDGNNNYREIHGHINPNGYILNAPTELTIANEGPYTMVVGSDIEHTSISNDPEVKVTFYYPGQNNTFNVRLGVRTNNSNGSVTRQYAVSFDPCATYTTANVTPLIPVLSGLNNTCIMPSFDYFTTGVFSSYTWTVVGGNIVSGQGTGNVAVDWTTVGNRSIRLRTVDGNGCVANTTRSVTVNANPTITAANTGPYCTGATIQLNSNTTLGTTPYAYNWNGPLTYMASTSAPTRTNALLTHSGTYSVTVTDANNCSATASTAVTVSADPIISITTTTPGTVCVGQSATFNASYTGGAGTCTIQWQTRIGSGAWTDILGATGASYTVSSVSATAQFRALVTCTGGGCCE